MQTNDELREVYSACYRSDIYRMGSPRRARMLAAIKDCPGMALPYGGMTLLDVGCGRGELLQDAIATGRFRIARGYEIVPDLCGRFDGYDVKQIATVAQLPFEGRFDIVTCSDVLEHVLPEETSAALHELWTSTACTMILHVAWFAHQWQLPNGDVVDLHINKRGPTEWFDLVVRATPDAAERRIEENGSTAVITVTR